MINIYNENRSNKSITSNDTLDNWLNQFLDGIDPLSLPIDYEKSKNTLMSPAITNFLMPKELEEKIEAFTLNNNLKPELLLLTVYVFLISKYSNKKNIAVGALFNNSNISSIQPVKSSITNNISIIEFMNQINSSLKDFEKLKDVSLVELNIKAKEFGLEADNLFDTVFIYEDIIENNEIKQETSFFDFNIRVFKTHDGINFNLEYNKSLFSIETIKRMGSSYITLLNNFIRTNSGLLGNINILTTEERETLIESFNNTAIPLSNKNTIVSEFESQVNKTPDNIALYHNGESITYKQLNEKANKGANQLLNMNLPSETVVGLYQDTSIDLIVSLLSILKAGFAYLPMDSSTPIDRALTMLNDSNAKVLITDSCFKHSIDNLTVINIKNYFMEEASNPLCQITGNNLAYIIYTSGTTGKPKGVMIEHRSVLNLANWFNREINFKVNSRMLQMTKICFDVSVDEILCTLINGASIYIPQDHMRLDKKALTDFINEHNINVAEFVPSLLPDYIINNDIMPSLNIVLTGAERLQPSIRDKVLDKGYTLFNLYGPTETTVTSAFIKCNKELDVIGKPIDNTDIYVIDAQNNLTPIGVPGELVISGIGLSRGYLGDKDLSDKKFISNPFKNNSKIYKTGDLARWLPNGNLEFLGRIDNQVKIRGFRVEPGEVESRLLEHQGVKEACVIVKKDNLDNNYLVAFICVRNNTDIECIKSFLDKNLPYYMVPSPIVILNSIPTTKNGKYDRAALLSYEKPEIEKNEKSSQNSLENKLTNILCSILDVDNIDIQGSFEENGANSIHQIKLIDKINDLLDINISILTLLENPTIKSLAANISESVDV